MVCHPELSAEGAQSKDALALPLHRGRWVSMEPYYVYMLLCADGSFYVGITNDSDRRVAEHNVGLDPDSYTHERRPVRLVHCSGFRQVLDAIRWEKQLKGWSRAKKRALVNDDCHAIHEIVRTERRFRERKRCI
jgi:putative endonuclease